MVIFERITGVVEERKNNSNEVTQIKYQKHSYSRRKKNVYSKKLKKHYDVFYCMGRKGTNCRVMIRRSTVQENGVQYFLSLQQHICIPEIMEKKSKKRKLKLKFPEKSEILKLDPNSGSIQEINRLKGINVNIIFSVSEREYYNRFLLMEGEVTGVYIGNLPCTLGKVRLFELDSLAAQNCPEVHDAHFFLPVRTPPPEHPGYVDVEIRAGSGTIKLCDGFLYIDSLKSSPPLDPFNLGGFGGSGGFDQDNNYGDDDNGGGGSTGGSSGFEDDDLDLFGDGFPDYDSTYGNDYRLNEKAEDVGMDYVDVFGANMLSYHAANGNMKKVQHLVNSLKFDIHHHDILGLTAVDVARYFDRTEILNFLKDPEGYYEKRKIVCICIACDGNERTIHLDFENEILGHICKTGYGAGSRPVKYKERDENRWDILTFRHIPSGGKKCGNLSARCLKEGSKCEGCGSFIRAGRIVLRNRYIAVFEK